MIECLKGLRHDPKVPQNAHECMRNEARVLLQMDLVEKSSLHTSRYQRSILDF